MYQLPLLLLATTLLVGCNATSNDEMSQQNKRPTVVKLMAPTNAAETASYEFPAKTEAFRTVDLAFEVSGKVEKLALDEGQDFKKGDLLVALNPDSYQRRVKQSQLQLKEAKTELDRIKTLDKKGYISHQKLTQAQTNYELARINLASSQADLEHSELYAPFNGVVSKRFTEKNSFIAPGTKVAELQDLSKTYFAVDMPEKLVVGLSKDMEYKAYVKLPNIGLSKMEVRYSEHENTPNPITQTYRVYFSMPQIDGVKVTVGSIATLTLTVESPANKGLLMIPFSALVSGENGSFYVWKLQSDSNTVSKQLIEVAQIQGQSVQVLAGLKIEDQFVAAGVSKMRDGLKVKAYQGSK